MHIIVVARRLYALTTSAGNILKTGSFGQCHDTMRALKSA